MNSNAPADNLTDNPASPDESGEWVITLYEPYHVPPEPKEGGDEGDGWVLTIYEPYCLPLRQQTP